jgi:hypothetical protein
LNGLALLGSSFHHLNRGKNGEYEEFEWKPPKGYIYLAGLSLHALAKAMGEMHFAVNFLV